MKIIDLRGRTRSVFLGTGDHTCTMAYKISSIILLPEHKPGSRRTRGAEILTSSSPGWIGVTFPEYLT
jgi:hypothetical protein